MIKDKLIKALKTVVKKIIAFGNQCACRIVYFFRKNKKQQPLIIFESRSDFSDNTKSVFDEAIRRKLNKKYKMVWFVDNPDNFKDLEQKYENVYFHARKPKGIRSKMQQLEEFTTADFAFYSHSFIGWEKNSNQQRFFLTHASPPLKNSTGLFWKVEKNTHILSTSDFAAKYRCQTFGGGLDRVRVLGFPRNDRMFDNNRAVLEKLGLEDYNKIILYMPTFKHRKPSRWNKRNDFDSDTDQDISLFTEKFLNDLNLALQRENAVLVVKYHPAQDMNYVKNIDCSNIKTYLNEDLIAKNVELYAFLGLADALITDFSSVYFDYLLLDRPIAFELKDQSIYGRGFIFEDPLQYMPGEYIYQESDFLKFINDVCDGKDEYMEERARVRNLIHKYHDGNSAKRILDFLNLVEE